MALLNLQDRIALQDKDRESLETQSLSNGKTKEQCKLDNRRQRVFVIFRNRDVRLDTNSTQ